MSHFLTHIVQFWLPNALNSLRTLRTGVRVSTRTPRAGEGVSLATSSDRHSGVVTRGCHAVYGRARQRPSKYHARVTR